MTNISHFSPSQSVLLKKAVTLLDLNITLLFFTALRCVHYPPRDSSTLSNWHLWSFLLKDYTLRGTNDNTRGEKTASVAGSREGKRRAPDYLRNILSVNDKQVWHSPCCRCGRYACHLLPNQKAWSPVRHCTDQAFKSDLPSLVLVMKNETWSATK